MVRLVPQLRQATPALSDDLGRGYTLQNMDGVAPVNVPSQDYLRFAHEDSSARCVRSARDDSSTPPSMRTYQASHSKGFFHRISLIRGWLPGIHVTRKDSSVKVKELNFFLQRPLVTKMVYPTIVYQSTTTNHLEMT